MFLTLVCEERPEYGHIMPGWTAGRGGEDWGLCSLCFVLQCTWRAWPSAFTVVHLPISKHPFILIALKPEHLRSQCRPWPELPCSKCVTKVPVDLSTLTWCRALLCSLARDDRVLEGSRLPLELACPSARALCGSSRHQERWGLLGFKLVGTEATGGDPAVLG